MKKGEIDKKLSSPATVGAAVPDTVPATTPALIEYFQTMQETDNPLLLAWELSPYPTEIFAPDGTLVYLNRSLMNLNGMTDKSTAVGVYNILKDTVCMDELGYREETERAFRGEIVIVEGFPVPVQDLIDRGLTNDKPYEAAILDLYLYPVRREKTLCFIVCCFHVRSLYMGRADVVRAKEYIDRHWKEDFNKTELAKAVGMSTSQLYRVFEEYAGMPPGEYYNHVKVRHIKDKLEDTNLSIKEAFAQCGESSQGWIRKVFKEIIGMSPSEYRKKFFANDLKL